MGGHKHLDDGHPWSTDREAMGSNSQSLVSYEPKNASVKNISREVAVHVSDGSQRELVVGGA